MSTTGTKKGHIFLWRKGARNRPPKNKTKLDHHKNKKNLKLLRDFQVPFRRTNPLGDTNPLGPFRCESTHHAGRIVSQTPGPNSWTLTPPWIMNTGSFKAVVMEITEIP